MTLNAVLSFESALKRSRTARETLAKVRPHLSSLGITRIGELTGLDHIGLPVAMAVRPNSRSLSVSLGKGADKDSALVSAVMEAVETSIAENLPNNLFWGSQAEIEQTNGRCIDFDLVARCHPLKFERAAKTAWARTTNLVSGEACFVPWALIGLDHRQAPEGFHSAFYVTSDGLASGNNREEAIFHGLCELIERDALSKVQFSDVDQLARCRVEISGNEDPLLPEIMSTIEAAGLNVRLFRCDDGSVYPVFLALLDARHADGFRSSRCMKLCGGTGCHPLPGRAIVKAIAEAAQARLALVAGARDDIDSEHYGNEESIVLSEALARNPGIAQGLAKEEHPLELNIVEKLANTGITQVCAYEFDCSQLGVSVIRVIAIDLQVPLSGDRVQITPRGYQYFQGFAA